MKSYNTTTKLWLKVEADSLEEAKSISKSVVDDAMLEYFTENQNRLEGIRVSKGRVIWVKEETQKET